MNVEYGMMNATESTEQLPSLSLPRSAPRVLRMPCLLQARGVVLGSFGGQLVLPAISGG